MSAAPSVFEQDLDRHRANHCALTPISLLYRSAAVFPDKLAVVDGPLRFDYRTLLARCRRLAAALAARGIGQGDCVAMLCANTHEMIEAHFGVPMAGAVLNALNIRLDPDALRYILVHSGARMLIYDASLQETVRRVVAPMDAPPALVCAGAQSDEYEAMLAAASEDYAWQPPQDEWQAIALNYTSGTTGNPKGVVYHHRGAYLAALCNALGFGLDRDSVYLWTLPMFHCNGWCYVWAAAAVGATHVCLPKIDPAQIQALIAEHGVTHMCGAPVVLNLLLNDFSRRDARLDRPVRFLLGGAAPPVAVIGRARVAGFAITHAYGLTETFGPSALCVAQPGWDELDDAALAQKMSRQGVANLAIDALRVVSPETGEPVPADGRTLGELLVRGNTVMKGYLKNPAATAEAFQGGWFHTGDLSVVHPDGYVEVKDRSKDIIISGGENISSKEIEEVLYTHPQVLEAAVVACPDEKWGEVPCAFVCFKDDSQAPTGEELIAYCRARLAAFKAPRRVVVAELPKTATGKIRKNLLRDSLRGGPAAGGQA